MILGDKWEVLDPFKKFVLQFTNILPTCSPKWQPIYIPTGGVLPLLYILTKDLMLWFFLVFASLIGIM